VLKGYEGTDDHSTFWLPFGYCLEHDADLLILRRSNGSFVAAFSALDADLFEVELRLGKMPSRVGSSVHVRFFRFVESLAATRNLTIVQEGENNRTMVRFLSKYQSTRPNYVS